MFGIFQAFLDVHNEKIEYVTNISTDVSVYCGYFCYSIDIGKFIRCYRIIELEMCLVMIIQCWGRLLHMDCWVLMWCKAVLWPPLLLCQKCEGQQGLGHHVQGHVLREIIFLLFPNSPFQLRREQSGSPQAPPASSLTSRCIFTPPGGPSHVRCVTGHPEYSC